jgi:membrane-bound lytic murein transglycosylase D
MLMSSVPVFFLSLTLTIALPSAANSATSEPAKPVSTIAGNVILAKTSVAEVSFALPGKRVQKFVDSYIRENDESLTSIRGRSKRPFTIMDSVFKKYGLPEELKYLAVIESELRSTALSRVGARGPWQLMAQTARDLGLRVNGRSDERTSIYKSTKAAALYLRDLHNQFKDWLLVLAAYNAGPRPVERAIHRSHSRNFWALERYLPAETRQHIKRFIATEYYFNTFDTIDPLIPAIPADNAVCAGQQQEGFPEFLGTL